MSIKSIIQTAAETTFLDEDGRQLSTEIDEPLTLEQVERYEARLERSLPDAMRELLLFSDGVTVGGVEIQCASGQEWHDEFGLLAFHSWGNGDFDCLSLEEDSLGAVFFINHSPAVSVRVADSLETWLAAMLAEMTQRCSVLHPGDYRYREETSGVYAHVLKELSGHDCELNR